jgi:hypothetical protein
MASNLSERSNMRLWAHVIGGVIMAIALVGVVGAAEGPVASECAADCAAKPGLPSPDIVPDVPAGLPVPPNDPAVQANMPGCAVWTDRCVTCQRESNNVRCSNIGIACQPQALECLLNDPPKEKKTGN